MAGDRDRGVRIGGDATGNVIVTGDRNQVTARVAVRTGPAVDPATVDMARELAAIRAVLLGLGSEHGGKIGRALDDADEEAGKAGGADKAELGGALDRALRLAKSAGSFAEVAGKLAPHVHAAVAWLGDAWSKLLTHLA